MKSTTAKYKQIIASGITRKYLVTINLTLANNTQLTLTEADIWGDSLTIETASSGTDTFDLGCAVIGRCKFSIENHDERFSSYDFFNATAVVWLKLDGDTTYYRMGFFTVDEPKGSSSLITLELLDNMWKFDTDLPTLTMPAALGTIVNDLCIHCGVTLATQNFRGYNYTLSELPDEEMNCRELLQYVAMIGCNFCVINASGSLDIRWYDEIPAYDHLACVGDYVGVYVNSSNENTYANIDRFMRNYEVAIGTGDITITGVKITIDDTDYQIGSSGYMLKIENPLVTVDNVSAILNLIWGRLAGFTFRTFDVTMLSDLAVEVGDACAIRDIKGNIIYSIVTNNSFELSTHSVSTGAVTPTRSLTRNYSKAVQTSVEIARKVAEQKISSYDLAVQAMNSLAINAMGGYEDYEDLASGGRVWYLSNMPITKDAQGHCSFETGSTVFKTTGDGLFVSTDGGITWTNGYNAQTGELLVNVLHAIGINAEWINTGQLTVGGSTSGTNNPQIVVKDADNNEICTINSNGIIMRKGTIQSADYAYTTGNRYSTSGMIIDLVNTYMRSTAFFLNNNGGYIGAAKFDDTALRVIGDMPLYSGRGTFQFVPYEYRLAEDCEVSYHVDESASHYGYVAVYLKNTETEARTYVSGMSIQPGETVIDGNFTMDHTVGGPGKENLCYEFEVSLATGYPDVDVSLYEAVLAYMGEGGFKGTLEGTFYGYEEAEGKFTGYVDSDRGKIAGYDYEKLGVFRNGTSVTKLNERSYNNSYSVGRTANGFHVVAKTSNGHSQIGFAIDNGFDDSNNEGVTDIEGTTPHIFLNLNKIEGQATATISRYQDYDGKTNASVVWNDEFGDYLDNYYTITTADIGEGVPLAAGHFVLVVEP